jgi:hypothetical protein
MTYYNGAVTSVYNITNMCKRVHACVSGVYLILPICFWNAGTFVIQLRRVLCKFNALWALAHPQISVACFAMFC